MTRKVLLAATILMAPWASEAQTTARLDLDWPAVAEKILERLALEPGARVLLVARPGMFDALIPHLRYAVAEAGGTDLGVVDVLAIPLPTSLDQEALARSNRDARESYRRMFRDVDAAVMLPGASTNDAAYMAMQDLLHEGQGRTIHFHWLENGSVYPVPGQAPTPTQRGRCHVPTGSPGDGLRGSGPHPEALRAGDAWRRRGARDHGSRNGPALQHR